MDEPWKHDAKWSEPDTKGRIVFDFSHMSCVEQVNSQGQKVEQKLPGALEKGEWAVVQ